MNNGFNSRKFKGGAYTTILSVLVIFIVLVLNLVVSGMVRTKDLTGAGTYSLHKDTVNFLKNYDTAIDIYYICEPGKENSIISNAAENFAAKGKNITITYKDPVAYPMFVQQYNGVSANVNNNSVILVRHDNPDERYVYIDAESMKIYSINQKDFQTKELTGYCAEVEILKALVKLSDASDSILYVATGHGEQMLAGNGNISTELENLLSLNSYKVRYVDLKKNPIPEDCSALLVLGPIDDISEEESTVIKDYITNGGRAVWFLACAGAERPVQQSLMNYYGIHVDELFVCDADTSKTAQNQPAIILSSHNKKNTQFALGVGVTKMPNLRDSLEVEAVFTSSNQGYLKSPTSKVLTYVNGDPKGVYSLLTRISENYKNQVGMMYVFNTQYFLSKQCLESASSYANSEVLLETLGTLCEKESSISIPDTSAFEEALRLTTHQKNVLMIILIGIIPGIVLLCGIVVVIMRRR